MPWLGSAPGYMRSFVPRPAERLTTLPTYANSVKVHFADLTDRASVDYLVRELGHAPDKPSCFTLALKRTLANRGIGPTKPL